MSQRFLCLAQGEELVVTLKKPYLNLEDCSEGILVEDRFLVSQEKESFCYWGPLGWCFQWQLERAPFFQCVEKIFGRTDNVYCYKVAQGSGTINLSFISHTYPRYYASLHLHVEKQREEK